MRRIGERRGFALLGILWILAWIAVLGLPLLLTGREMQEVAGNRIALTSAQWAAEGCLERARAAASEALGDPVGQTDVWTVLDDRVLRSALVGGCRLMLRPTGVTLDVNNASGAELVATLRAAGVATLLADSLADAILDWRDVDDSPRANGCEHACAAAGRFTVPRNGPIASLGELRSVRGMEHVPGLDTLLSVEPGRVLLSRAPIPVLMSLPGADAALAAAVNALRIARSAVTLESIAMMMPEAASASWMSRAAALTARTTSTPDAWIISASATSGHPIVRADHDLRVALSGRRLVILRRRAFQ